MEQLQKFISKTDLGIDITTPFSKLASSFIMMACGFNRVNELLAGYSKNGVNVIVSEILKRMDIVVSVFDNGRLKIPKTGGFIAVANYPHGILDILIMAHVIIKMRPDARFLLKNELVNIPFVNDLALVSSKEPIPDATLVRKAIEHIKDGHPLIVFPASVSASYSRGFSRVVDTQWNHTIFKIASLVDVPLQSYFINGNNTSFYLALRKLSSPISSAMIVREMFAQQFSDITVVISDLFNHKDTITQAYANQLKSSQKNAIVAHYARALTFMQEHKIEKHEQTKIITKHNQQVVIKNNTILFEKSGYKACINSDRTQVIYEKDNKQILSYTVTHIKRGNHTVANWFTNFDLSRTASALIERDAVEIFNVSYLPSWNYIDVEFISETFKYLAKIFKVTNIIIQDAKEYYYSQSTAYTLLNQLLEKTYAQKSRNKFVVPRSPAPSSKPISHRIAFEVLNFPNITLFIEEIKKSMPIEISPLIPAVILAGGKYIASASPMSRTSEMGTTLETKIMDQDAQAPKETISQSVNLLFIRL